MHKRVLVTGGTGFVGANLARRLLREGCEVHLLVRPGHQVWRLEGLARDVQFHTVLLSDPDAADAAVAKVKPDWIFHLAAHGAYSYQQDTRAIVDTNLFQTMNLLRAGVKTGFEAFVNTGSSSEYGFKDHAPAEDERVDPNSDYAVTKAAATMFCRSIAATHSVHVPTLRLYSVYGPWEEPTRLIPALIVRGLEGAWPPLVNPGTARDFVYTEDVCEAYLLAARTVSAEPGPVYNVGSGTQTTLRELVAVSQGVFGISAPPQWNTMTGRSWDTSIWVSNNAKIKQELGWRPGVSLVAGLTRTCQWLRDDPKLMQRYRNTAGWSALGSVSRPG